MTYEQLHFAFGVLFPFLLSFFFYDDEIILYFPFIMTISGILASLPYYLNLTGFWTNIFFLYDIFHKIFTKGQFIGYFLIIAMFTIVLIFQALYFWRNEYA
jgi:hypothetical protein